MVVFRHISVLTASALLFAFSQPSSDVGEGDEVATVVIELTLGTVTSQTDITLSTSSLSAVGKRLLFTVH